MSGQPLPKLLVTLVTNITLETKCVVDVTGIEDPLILQEAFLATLWEHDFAAGDTHISFSSTPMERLPFSGDSLSPTDLFDLCRSSESSLKILLRHDGAFESRAFSPIILFNTQPTSPQSIPPDKIVITVVSHRDQRPLCTVHLTGAKTVGMIYDLIVRELQYHHYYLEVGPTLVTSKHQCIAPPRVGSADLFRDHFQEDIDLEGSLTLSVEAYQARTAERPIAPPRRSHVVNITGQALPRIIVSVHTRRFCACTVDFTGVQDPSIIRRRIITALLAHDYLIRREVIITSVAPFTLMPYEPLTDGELFSLCQERGDAHGSLRLFVEASEVRHASEYGLDSSRTPFKLPKILVSIADWNDQKHYGKVDVTGLDSYDALTKLKDTLEERTNRQVKAIYGPDWFSLKERPLFDLIRRKGDSKGTLVLKVVLGDSCGRGFRSLLSRFIQR